MKVLGIIPARGGSKGVLRKNIRSIGGRPLLAYCAESALAARLLDRVILSTDDDEIADVGKDLGLDVPFMRPAELAGDSAPTLPVVSHAIKFLEDEGSFFDAVCLLQPTNPLRRPADIDLCIELLEKTGADSVISVLPVPVEHNPAWTYRRKNDGTVELSTGGFEPVPRRQELEPAFHRDGTIYVTRTSVITELQSLYGTRIHAYEMDSRFSVNIDTQEDWDRAEALLAVNRI